MIFPPLLPSEGTTIALWQRRSSRYDGSRGGKIKGKKMEGKREGARGRRQIIVQMRGDIRCGIPLGEVFLLFVSFFPSSSSSSCWPTITIYTHSSSWQIRQRTNEPIFITGHPLPPRKNKSLAGKREVALPPIRLDSWREARLPGYNKLVFMFIYICMCTRA